MLKALAKKKSVVLNVRLEPGEREKFQALADKYAGGNLSAWLRYAALRYRPSAKELDPEEPVDGDGK